MTGYRLLEAETIADKIQVSQMKLFEYTLMQSPRRTGRRCHSTLMAPPERLAPLERYRWSLQGQNEDKIGAQAGMMDIYLVPGSTSHEPRHRRY